MKLLMVFALFAVTSFSQAFAQSEVSNKDNHNLTIPIVYTYDDPSIKDEVGEPKSITVDSSTENGRKHIVDGFVNCSKLQTAVSLLKNFANSNQNLIEEFKKAI